MKAKLAPWALAVCTIAFAAPVMAQHEHQRGGDLSAVVGPAHASAYAEGLYLLHNFEYPRAREAFRRAQAEDPGNVMAYWGEAMVYNHPLWASQDRAKARQALAKLGADPASRRAKARTGREAAWLDAVETLYGEGEKRARDRAYHAAMMALHGAYPNDIDARTFAALATLGLAHEGRDTAIYMRAAALLEEGLADNPDHPGLLHYLIHSYDDPAHAPLGLRAARRYAAVAPDAGHAQHMVSHIYLAVGDWAQVEATNIQAMKVVNAEDAAAGQPLSLCGHYNEWLAYALDQQGKDSRALVDGCWAEGLAEVAAGKDSTVLGDGRSYFNNAVTIAVRHGVDTGRWPGPVPMGDSNSYMLGRFELTYARLLAARGDAVAAATALADLRRYRAVIAEAMPKERPDDHESAKWLDLTVEQGAAIAVLAAGEREEALRLLQLAAAREAALPQPFGPPLLAKPNGELLAEELLAAGRAAEAAAAYHAVLDRMPGRRLAIQGLDRAVLASSAQASD